MSSSSSVVSVYTPGFKSVLTLPMSAVVSLPDAPSNRLVLCANYDAKKPGSCVMGAACKFVHADTAAAREHSIHVNYAWRSIDEVAYERFPAGQSFRVAPPNSKSASDVMDSEFVLKTRALASHRRPLSHCAHYYFNRTCNLGAECQFIHAVFVDPAAKPFQRAPVPSQLGEGRELQLSKKQREALTRVDGAADHAEAILNLSQTRSMTSYSSSAVPRATSVPASSTDGATTPRSHNDTGSCSSCPCVGARFRYDPYSVTSPKVIMCCA